MGIRVRIEVFDDEGQCEAASEFVDRECSDIDRLGYLIGYAVKGVSDFVIWNGDLSDGLSESIAPGMLGNIDGDSA